MKKTNMKNLMFVSSFTLIAISVIFTFVIALIAANDYGFERDYTDFSDGWMDENMEAIHLDKLSESCRIHKEIPKLDTDLTLSFNARNINVCVYVDDICVYKVKETNNPFLNAFYGKTSGSAFAEIPIHKEYSGKTLYIDIINPYSNGNACKIVNMFLGNGTQIVKHHTSVQLGSFCFDVIILFLGIVCVLLYIPMAKNKIADRSMLYLGITAFTFGMSGITDCKMLHIIVGQESLYYTVSQMFMALIPVPLLLFFEKLHGNLNNKIIIALCAANIIDFIVVFTLNFMDIYDYHDNAMAILLVIALSIIYISFISIKDIFTKGSENIFHNIGIIMIALSFILDLIMGRANAFVETSFFTRIGLAGFTLMECMQVLWKHKKNYQKGLQAQLVSRLAYHDGLTDMLNRTSFIEEMDSLESENHSDIIIAIFDVNNLKYVNDNFGHTDGDELIINVAKSIQNAFGELGKCFRIGGDEFVFIAKRANAEDEFLEAREKMIKELNEIDSKYEYPVSVAVGYAINNGNCSNKLKELLDEADEKMYANKKAMKAKIQLQSAS